MFVAGQTTGFYGDPSTGGSFTPLANDDVSYSFANSLATAPNEYAIFQTHDPWGRTAVKTAITNAGHTYTVFTPGQLAGFDFSQYRVVVLNWSDTFVTDFDPAYTSAIPDLQNYVRAGGVLWIEGAIRGGSTYALPFGGTVTIDGQANNFIVDGSPLVAGMPNPFSGSDASQVSFAGYPGTAHVIVVTGTAAGGATTLYELHPCP
jgi:hypothetical protein